MSVSGRLICRLAEEASEAPGPDRALRTLTELRSELDEFERQQVARALTAGQSFGDVARSMGISRQAAHRRFRDLAPGRVRAGKLVPTAEVRLAVDYARTEAAALAAPALTPEHVLLGLLRAGDGRAAPALTVAGATLEDARRHARVRAGRHPRKDELRPPDADGRVDIRATLGQAVRCATRRGAAWIEAEDLLRGALQDEDGSASALLSAMGVTPDRVLAALDEPRRIGAEAGTSNTC